MYIVINRYDKVIETSQIDIITIQNLTPNQLSTCVYIIIIKFNILKLRDFQFHKSPSLHFPYISKAFSIDAYSFDQRTMKVKFIYLSKANRKWRRNSAFFFQWATTISSDLLTYSTYCHVHYSRKINLCIPITSFLLILLHNLLF